MLYSELLAGMQVNENGVALDVTGDWMQGRSVFGGLQASIAVAAMRRFVNTPLRTLQLTFIAPVPAGRVTAQARVLRSGKNATHVEARIMTGDEVACIAIGVFGTARASVIAKLPQQQPVVPQAPIEFPYIEGITPEFIRHFRGTVLQGDLPYCGKPLDEVIVRLDMIDHGTATEAHLLALADFMPPIALCWLKNLAAGSSMTCRRCRCRAGAAMPRWSRRATVIPASRS
jgi:acyl-coenzyme A thioesterase PaaI-like protein